VAGVEYCRVGRWHRESASEFNLAHVLLLLSLLSELLMGGDPHSNETARQRREWQVGGE